MICIGYGDFYSIVFVGIFGIIFVVVYGNYGYWMYCYSDCIGDVIVISVVGVGLMVIFCSFGNGIWIIVLGIGVG